MLQKYITDEGQEIVFEPSPKWVRAVFNGEVIADCECRIHGCITLLT